MSACLVPALILFGFGSHRQQSCSDGFDTPQSLGVVGAISEDLLQAVVCVTIGRFDQSPLRQVF
ncbi:MAG: hypothetical protein OEQ39_28910, partial [Gammaproteobacteria bacterium]|nr:hypothetical protein [Gammaproteobacteria bacterium]